ncbi:MAG: hypothetical protein QUV07_04630 [Cyanobium sp. CZS 25K]|nr:hypothetical protein [Cyanobium sp. CZS25K]
MDHLDQLGAKAFDGYLVRKYSRQYPVPTYVVEFLLGRYCVSTAPARRAPLPPHAYARMRFVWLSDDRQAFRLSCRPHSLFGRNGHPSAMIAMDRAVTPAGPDHALLVMLQVGCLQPVAGRGKRRP